MSAERCVPLANDGRLTAPLLEQVDCQVAHYVEATYASLFGPFGFLEPLLTGALTIYIAVYGYQLIVGRSGLSLSGLAPKVLLIGFVLAFAGRWGAYEAVFLNVFYSGADEIAGLMLGGAAQGGVYTRLDGALQEIIRLAGEWNDSAIQQEDALQVPPPPQMQDTQMQDIQGAQPKLPSSAGAVNLLWVSALLLALSTVGVLIIAKILLGLLLAVGPVLVILALFSATRGLFEGWLKTMAQYAFVAAFAIVLTGGVMLLVEPMVANIAEARAWRDAGLQPVFVLAVTVAVFALLMQQVVRMCGKLAGAWRLPESATRIGRDEALAAPAPARSNASVSGRVSDIVVAVERSGAAAYDARARNSAAAVQAPLSGAGASSTYMSRRTGQRYRGFSERLGARARFA
jgi:type IV secretion system protein VirB6